jgi:hypothetical protein
VGRAVLTRNIGEGLYEIEYIKGRERRAAALSQIDIAIAGNGSAQTQQEAVIAVLEADLAASLVDLNNAITIKNLVQIRSETAERNSIALRLRAARDSLESLKITEGRLRAVRKNIAAIQSKEVRQVWVADYSLDVEAGENREFGTAEVDGTPGEVILLPMGDVSEPDRWNLADHGEVYSTDLVTPGTAYYARGIFPGWQKYLPAYRIGRITRIDPDDTVNVEAIEPNESTEQGLPITPTLPNEQPIAHTMLAVEYLDCGAAAFSVDDEVLVRYPAEARDMPVVIGFRDHPKPCAFLKIFIPNGSFTLSGDTWNFELFESPLYGNLNWFHPSKRVGVSWQGPKGRHVGFYESDFDLIDPTPNLYSEGRLLAVAPGNVIGACIVFAGSVKTYIVAVTTDYEFESEQDTITEELWRRPYNGTDDDWEMLSSHSWPNDFNVENAATLPSTFEPVGHYFFNASGTRAVSSKIAFYRNPASPFDDQHEWTREATITLSQDASSGNFAFETVEDGSAVLGDSFTFDKTVGRDFIEDEEITLFVRTVYDKSGSDSELDRSLVTSVGYAAFLSRGTRVTNSLTENFGRSPQYIDLRETPPVVIYRNTAQQTALPMSWSLRIDGAITDEELASAISYPTGFGGNDFSRFADVRSGEINNSITEALFMIGSGTAAINDRGGIVLVDPEFVINAMYPDADINALSGLDGIVSPIGLG